MKSIARLHERSLVLLLAVAAGSLIAPKTKAQQPAEETADPESVIEPTAPPRDGADPRAPVPMQAAPAPAPAIAQEENTNAQPGPAPVTPATSEHESSTASPVPAGPDKRELSDATPALAPAASLPLAISGSFWSRYEMRSGYAKHGLSHPRLHREGDYLVSRARMTLKTTPKDVGDGLMAFATFTPQAAYTMGETGGPATVGDHPPLMLYEGFASIGGANARFDAGRFMLNYGDALVIGNLGWNEAARSFNGARLHLTPGGSAYYIDVFATIISDGRRVTQKPLQGDVYFWGAYAGIGPALGEGLELDAYLLGQSTARNEHITLTDPADESASVTGELEPTTELTLGFRHKGKTGMLDHRVEAGFQFGKSPVNPTFEAPDPAAVDKLAYHADAELGLTPAAGFRLALEGLLASGDNLDTSDENEGYNPLYPTAHKFLGFADIVGDRTNVGSGVLHLSYAPTKPLTLTVDAHYFTRLKAGADGKDGSMGVEIDTNILYAFGGGASVRGMYAVFLPAEDFWETKATNVQAAGDPFHYLEVQFGYDFK